MINMSDDEWKIALAEEWKWTDKGTKQMGALLL